MAMKHTPPNPTVKNQMYQNTYHVEIEGYGILPLGGVAFQPGYGDHKEQLGQSYKVLGGVTCTARTKTKCFMTGCALL